MNNKDQMYMGASLSCVSMHQNFERSERAMDPAIKIIMSNNDRNLLCVCVCVCVCVCDSRLATGLQSSRALLAATAIQARWRRRPCTCETNIISNQTQTQSFMRRNKLNNLVKKTSSVRTQVGAQSHPRTQGTCTHVRGG